MVQARTTQSFQRDVIDTCQNFKCACSFLNTSAFGNATLQTFWAHKNVCTRQFSREIGCISSIDKKEFYTRFKNHLHMCVWDCIHTCVHKGTHRDQKKVSEPSELESRNLQDAHLLRWCWEWSPRLHRCSKISSPLRHLTASFHFCVSCNSEKPETT